LKNFERWRGARTTQHLGRQLLILYALTAAAVAAVFMSALLVTWANTTSLLGTIGQSARIIEQYAQLQSYQSEYNATLATFLASGDEAAMATYRATGERRRELLASLQANERLTGEQAATLQSRFASIDAAAERAIVERRGGSVERALALWRADGLPQADAVVTQLSALSETNQRAREDELDIIRRNHAVTVALTIVFSAAVAFLGLWVTRRVILSITRPLEALAGAAAAIGEGQLDTRVAPGLSVEFDMLGGVMNQMAAHLSESRSELQDALAATERRNRELRLLSEVGEALDSALDLEAIIGRSLALILPAFQMRLGAVILLNEAGESWYWCGPPGSDQERDEARAAWRPILAEALGRQEPLARAVQVLAVPDPDAGSATPLALVPLEAAVRTYGVIALVAPANWEPDTQDRLLLGQIGAQLARAVENVSLYIAEKGRSAEAGMLAQMAQLTSGTLDPDRLARLIARYAVHVLGVDRCIIGFFDPRGDAAGRVILQRLYQYGFQPPQAALVEDEREGLQAIVRQHMLDGQSLVAPDARADERPAVLELARRLEARSFITMPLIARERHVGLIYLDTREPRQHNFGTQDQRILHAIADQAAAAIDGAWRFEAERRRGAQLRLLNETGQQIAASADLDRLFAEVTARIRDAFGYDRVRIGLIDDDELEFVAGASHTDDVSTGGGQPAARLPLALESPLTQVARSGKPRVLTESDSVRRGRIGLVVPLRGSESVIGVLEAVGGRPGGLDRDDERTLASLGDQLGIAVERSRLQERALSLAVVEERNRLARELHDSVTQALFSITLTIEAARLLVRRDVEATERQLVALGERAQEALSEMRALIHSLRPAGLEDNGLVPALKRIAERMRREHLLTVEVAVGAGARQRPDDEQERELYRIAQEALNNIVKHAAATHVGIRLDATDDLLTMTIEDDGKGFDTSLPHRDDAFGIVGMYERAAILKGTVEVESHPGRGTRISVNVPRGTSLLPAPMKPRQIFANVAGGLPAGVGGTE
jgi:signal transduction histidine kinase